MCGALKVAMLLQSMYLKTLFLPPAVKGCSLPRMERATPTFNGLDADQVNQLAKEAVVHAIVSTTRVGIPLAGSVVGGAQTFQTSDPHIAKFLQEQSVSSIQIESDPDTGLLVGNVPGIPGAHTQGETVEELCANLTEVLEKMLVLGACRTWGVESENRPQRDQFLPDLQPNRRAIGQKDGKKWAAAVNLQPTIPKSDRLLGSSIEGPLADRTHS